VASDRKVNCLILSFVLQTGFFLIFAHGKVCLKVSSLLLLKDI